MTLTLKDVTKRFKKRVAVDRFSMEFQPGVYGLLGPNGAGKTTLLRCICGLYRLDGGAVQGGENPGYLPQSFGMFRELDPVSDDGIPGHPEGAAKGEQEEEIRRVLGLVNLSDRAGSRVKALSGGMVRRAGIAQALLGDPEVLLFDEPTAGLDPEERVRFQNVVAARRHKGVTLISTHIVGDVEALCGTILILRQGKLAAVGTAQEIAQLAQGKVYPPAWVAGNRAAGRLFHQKPRRRKRGFYPAGAFPGASAGRSCGPHHGGRIPMRHQRFLRELALFRLTLRKLGPLYFVPHLFLYGLIPLLGAGYLAYHGDGENARGLIFYDFQKFLPFFGCWWVLFGLASYVEGSASELLQVYRPSLLGLFWLLWFWYLLHMAVLFGGFSLALENYWLDFPLLAIQSLAFAGVGFFLLCTARNLLAPFLTALFYEIFAMLSGADFLRFCNLFSLSRVEHLSQLVLPYGPVVGGSILLVVLGSWAYRRCK